MLRSIFSKQQQWDKQSQALLYKRYITNPNLSVHEWIDAIADNLTSHYSDDIRQHWKQVYYALLYNRTFLPTSAALHNVLRSTGSLSGCAVLPLGYSIEEIINRSIPNILRMLRAGIGVGMDLSHLPPRLGPDSTGNKAHPGPVPLLSAITCSAGKIMEYAGFKRAAFMATLRYDHFDIYDFITCKQKEELHNVNISVTTDQTFRKTLEARQLYPVRQRDNSGNISPFTVHDLHELTEQAQRRSVEEPGIYMHLDQTLRLRTTDLIVGKVIGGHLFYDAHRLLSTISLTAHRCGDPGIINLEAINETNPTRNTLSSQKKQTYNGTGEILTTTPCGEQPLLPYEVCHLGSINLTRFVHEDGSFEFDELQRTVPKVVRLMDDIIEHSDNSIRLANEVSRSNRKIGIGIMGWADVLAELNIPYDDEKAFSLASNVAQCIQESAVRASEDLANERGPFPNFTNSSLAKRGERPRRHATLTTIAPTGHISTLAGCSTAIEPYFLAAYMREAAGRQLEVARPLKKKLQALNFSLREWINATKLTRPDYAFDGTLAYLSDEPTKYSHVNSALQQIKTVFRTSHEISPENHMRMVECFQKHTDNGISKTINLPQGASIADVRHVFELALERGLKGITIFRDKCLSEQALQTLPTCPGCGGIEALTPSACGGYDCSKELGGCGYAACELPLRRLI